MRDFPGSPVVKPLPSSAEGMGLIPGWGAKMPPAQQPKKQNVKQKQYYNKFNKKTFLFESVLMRWMKLEPIIQSELSQKEKHQYSILTHTYGIQKDGNDDPVCETAKETQMYRTDFWTQRERERVG